MDVIVLDDVLERVEDVLCDNFFSPKMARKVAEAVCEDVYEELECSYDLEETEIEEIDGSDFRDAMFLPVELYLDEHLA